MILFMLPVINIQATAFITTWKTDNAGTSSSTQITIPGTGTYDVEWVEVGVPGNNGSTSGTGSVTVTFPSVGTYQVSIPSGMTRINFNNGGDKLKLLTIEQWGTLAWTSMAGAFYGCSNLTYNAVDAPDLSSVTDMSSMFRSCSNFNGAIGSWDVSSVTNMSFMFNNASIFNQDIGAWTVSSVTTMDWMFRSAPMFNADISGWDVANVTSMSDMFRSATAFNQNIGGWTLSSITFLANMFYQATNFNQDIGSWTVSNVTDTRFMFGGASSFNQDISGWDVGNVTNMNSMFSSATAFDQNLGNWDISLVTSMNSMLSNSGLSRTNYDNTLIGWEAQAVSGRPLGATGLIYCSGETARNALIADGWSFSGDSKDCTVFPVEWLSVGAKQAGNLVRLEWATASELNSDYFAVERSLDQQMWNVLDEVSAAGYSSTIQNYSYDDTQPFDGKAWYRLRQVDFDGKFITSKAVEIAFSPIEATIFPNPVQEKIFIDFRRNTPSLAMFIDMQGRMVKQITLHAGNNHISVSDLPTGIYILRLGDGQDWTQEIQVVKE
ncbi:MAG: BspA family leucine-rich repeat surface protein [Bacteroidia bacterium]|nr:BspA family leucine-rich repeat surface protein [Bacteroidia bacterium]